MAFASLASNLVAGDTNGTGEVFVRDRVAGTTVRRTGWPTSSCATGLAGTTTLVSVGR